MSTLAPYGAVPSARQLRWHALEMYGFVHFTVNTFTDKEWGYGDESPAVFNPSALDAGQWAEAARDAGLRGLILTAKHHDGFCLWPSRHTAHTVAASPWRGGKGDVVREFVDACRAYGLRAGLYLSPWDRHHAGYGTPAYVEYYRRQLDELLTQYGELFEIWFDGANGGDGYYGGARETRTIDRRTYYGFPTLQADVRRLQPDAVMFSDAGPDIRWVGNESGFASATCWAPIHPAGIEVGEVDDPNRLAWGEPDGTVWRPAEVDVSLRPGWFHHANEAPKSVEDLLSIYFCSVGRGCGLNLNLPPDRRGLLPAADVARLREFRRALDAILGTQVARGCAVSADTTHDAGHAPACLIDGNPDTYWAAADDARLAVITVDWAERRRIGCVRLEEYIPLGQRVTGFALDVHMWGQWIEMVTGTTIGPRRLLRLPPVATGAVRLRITSALANPVLRAINVYAAEE